jgi:segregation and condensation protein B
LDRAPLRYRPAYADGAVRPFAPRDEEIARLEAILFSADGPLPERRLMRLVDAEDHEHLVRLIERLNDRLSVGRAAYRVEETAGGWRLLCVPGHRSLLTSLGWTDDDPPLTPGMLETLTVVAYRQPINRADIEAIRGVQVGEILRQLLERGLVRIDGKEETLGRPFLYGTTRRFLENFGITDLKELPHHAGFQATGSAAPGAQPVLASETG